MFEKFISVMPTSYSRTAGLKPEDDWTRVKDPREKKRIQNRVAQRTYRHRMKARLGELQARLDSHERPNQLNDSNENSINDVPSTHVFSHHGQVPNSQLIREDSPLSTSSLTSNPGGVMALPLLNSNPYDLALAAGRSDPSQLQQEQQQPHPAQAHMTHLWNLPARTAKAQPHHGLLSPPTHADRCSTMVSDYLRDCQNLTATGYGDATPLPILEDITSTPNSALSSLPPTSNTLDLTLAHPTPIWNPPPSILSTPNPNAHTAPSVAAATSSSTAQDITTSPSTDPTSLWTNTTPAAATTLASSPDGRSPLDHLNFQDDFLMSARNIISNESHAAQAGLLVRLSPLLECHDQQGVYNEHTLTQMKQIVREDLPSSWAIAIAQGNGGGAAIAWQADCTNQALASVLIMHLTGKVPNTKLLNLVRNCL